MRNFVIKNSQLIRILVEYWLILEIKTLL